MKKRLIALCLALAFVLAALPGNLVSLAADSLGDLVGDEAVGVWGDFSEWVIMEATASFKTDSATLYYNPGTQPNNSVTLTGDDVPASFRVEYMLPLTAADGTVSYWYVLNTDEWAAFAGADVCPPYVRVEDVTDLTYLEVQGAADGVSAEFEKVDASTAPEEVDTSHMSGVTSIRGYDISLKDENGATWQPKDNGTTVTVRVYDAWDITVEKPIVDIYHVHGDGTVEVLSNTTGAVTLWPDGSVSFETDSFSNYYIVLGFEDGDYTLSNGDRIDVYVEPGDKVTFNQSATWTTDGDSIITVNGTAVTIGADVPLGEYEYTAKWGSRNSAPVCFHVSTRQQVIAEIVKDTAYPVYLAKVNNVSTIPSEPGGTVGSYTKVKQNQDGSYGVFGWADLLRAKTFSGSAQGIIDPRIADLLVNSIDGDEVIGFADATGLVLKQYLPGIDWDKLTTLAIDQGWTDINGNRIAADTHVAVPYVAKLMKTGNEDGWHIDVVYIPAEYITLSYDINLDNYLVTSTLELPETFSGQKGTSLEPKVGAINGSMKKGDKLIATYNGATKELTFLGWSTNPADTDYENLIQPGDSFELTENTKLYAIWEGVDAPGDLHVYKEVVGAPLTDVNKQYLFTVKFENFVLSGEDPTVPYYTVYNENGIAQNDYPKDINSTETAFTISFGLANGWYVVFKNIPAETTYTVTEVVADSDDYETTTTDATGTIKENNLVVTSGIRSGGRATVRYKNTYVEKVTITYQPVGGGTVSLESETVKVNANTAGGSIARPNDGYKFVGWYKDEACSQPVDAAWVSGNKITPQKNNEGKYVTATYYAKFEPDVTSLTIDKVYPEGADYSIDVNQSFLFDVVELDANNNEVSGTELTVVVHGDGSVTIDGLTVGKTYKITEKTDWSWRYEPAVASQNKTLAVNAEDNVVIFTNTRPNEQWLDGDSWCDNRFN